MQTFLFSLLRNLLVAAALAFLSSLLYRQPKPKEPEPQDNDFAPDGREGIEVKHLFGTGPVRLMTVAVVDRETTAIKR